MPRGRPSAEAADEAEVESVLKSAASGRSLANRERRSRGRRLGFAGIRPGLPDEREVKVRRYAKEEIMAHYSCGLKFSDGSGFKGE